MNKTIAFFSLYSHTVFLAKTFMQRKLMIPTTLRRKMKLFLAEHDTTLPQLAKKLEVSYPYLHQILNEKRRANEEIAEKLQAITQGLVTVEELRKVNPHFCPTCGKKMAAH